MYPKVSISILHLSMSLLTSWLLFTFQVFSLYSPLLQHPYRLFSFIRFLDISQQFVEIFKFHTRISSRFGRRQMCLVVIAEVVSPVEVFVAFIRSWQDALEWLFSGMDGRVTFEVLFPLKWSMAGLSSIVNEFASEFLLSVVVHVSNIHSVAM